MNFLGYCKLLLLPEKVHSPGSCLPSCRSQNANVARWWFIRRRSGSFALLDPSTIYFSRCISDGHTVVSYFSGVTDRLTGFLVTESFCPRWYGLRLVSFGPFPLGCCPLLYGPIIAYPYGYARRNNVQIYMGMQAFLLCILHSIIGNIQE